MSDNSSVVIAITKIFNRHLGQAFFIGGDLARSMVRGIFEKTNQPIPKEVESAPLLSQEPRCGGNPEIWFSVSNILAEMIIEIGNLVPGLGEKLDEGFGIIQSMYGPNEW